MIRRTVITGLVLLALILLCSGQAAAANLFVHDAVAVRGEELRIMIETRGLYLAKGGQRVEVMLNSRLLGNTLSGGDGVAYYPIRFRRTGTHEVIARAGKKSSRGTVSVFRKGAAIVAIDVEGTLLSRPFSRAPIEESREAIKAIMKRFPVVYLHSGTIGKEAVKAWLRKNRFPEAPVIDWNGGEIFSDLKSRGLLVRAVVGTQAVIDSAAEFRPRGFSFEEGEDRTVVRTWKEIERGLRQ